MIICFDLDGTLVNTEDWILNSMLVIFKKYKIKSTKKEIIKYWGVVFGNVLKLLNPSLNKGEIKEITADFEKERIKTIYKIKPYKNTKKTLNKLSKYHTLALVSNNSHKFINKILEQSKINKKLFKTIIGADEVNKPKPFPDEINKVEKKLNKKVIFLVGDSKQDIIAAKKAKIKSIIIKRKLILKKNLKGADFIIEDIKEIPKLIKETK